MNNWKLEEYPGYFGKKRDEIQAAWDQKYGPGNWQLGYLWGNVYIPRDMAIQLYEDGYYEYLKLRADILEWLVTTASDVYDTAPTNVEAGFSYTMQETPNNQLSPHLVPFHLPEMIYQGAVKDYPDKGFWWDKLGIIYSVEAFYQQNKILLVKE